MSKKYDGGPAFPTNWTTSPGGQVNPAGGAITMPGMTLRAYFAGEALKGFLSMFASLETPCPAPDAAAEYAVQYADALLYELNK